MGFLRRLLGGEAQSAAEARWPPKGPITSWPGENIGTNLAMPAVVFEPPECDGVELAGESLRQDTLELIAGGRTIDGLRDPDGHSAVLLPEPTNPDHPEAVRVVIVPTRRGQPWGLVGYLSREDAVAYGPLIDRVAALGRVVSCRATLTGGWDRGPDDRGSIGVVLVLGSPEECALKLDASPPKPA